MTRLVPALPLLLAALAACAGDRSFRPVDIDEDTDVDTDERRERPSPWDGVDIGERPDVMFAVVFHDMEAIDVDTQGRFRCETDAGANPAHYGFVDLEGRLIVDVPTPGELAVPSGSGLRRTASLGLTAAGPGRFLTVSEDHAAGGERIAWIADGIEESTERVLAWDAPDPTSDGQIRFTRADATLALPHRILDVIVAADPAEPDFVWLAPVYTEPLEADTPLLYRADLHDPERRASWTAEQLLGEPLGPTPLWVPGSLHVLRHDGTLRVLADWTAAEPSDAGVALTGPAIVSAFTPGNERVTWTQEVSYAPRGPAEAAIDAEGNAAWLNVSFGSDNGGIEALLDHQGWMPSVLTVPGGDTGLGCPRTEALFDPLNGTALFHGVPHPADGEAPTSSVLSIVHKGDEVWRQRGLTEGLGTRDVFIHDVAVLPGL